MSLPLLRSFPPLEQPGARVLVLGTMPGARSLNLAPDRGAQAALRDWPGGNTAVPMSAAGFDVDTPDDLEKLARSDMAGSRRR